MEPRTNTRTNRPTGKATSPRGPTFSPRLGLLLLLGLAVCVTGCGKRTKEEPSADRGPRIVAVTVPTRRTLERTLEVTGVAIAEREASVLPRLSGVPVIEVLKDLGDAVPANGLLARLERIDQERVVAEAGSAHREAESRADEAAISVRELEAQRKATLATIVYKERALARAREQSAAGAVASKVLEDAEYDLATERAAEERLAVQVEKAKAGHAIMLLGVEKAALAAGRAARDLEHTNVLGPPFPSVVRERMAVPGLLTGNGQMLFSVFDPSSVVVDVHVPQRNVDEVRVGLLVRLLPQTLNGGTVAATVVRVSPTIDREAGTVLVRVRPNEVGTLRPGQFVSGSIVLEVRPDVLVVPRKARDDERQRAFVWVIDATPAEGADRGTVRRVYFREGIAQDDHVEFLPGPDGTMLDSSERLVILGLDGLRDGDPVRIKDAAPTNDPPSTGPEGRD